MTTKLAGLTNSRTETFFERHAWKVLLGVSLILGIFGLGDMVGSASDLQNGETVLMHSLTGMSWDELKVVNPPAANLINWKFRSDGVSIFTVAVLTIAVCLTGFRHGQRWAWYALWAIPVWLALVILLLANAVKYPGYGTPVPIISGSIFFVLWVTLLGLSYRKFFRS